MRSMFLFVLTIIALVLESTFFSWFTFGEARVDLVLILVVFYSLFSGSKERAFFAFTAGLAQDIMVGGFIGSNALSKLVLAVVIGAVESKVYKDFLFVPLVLVFLGSLLVGSVQYTLLLPYIALPNLWSAFVDVMLPMAVYNLLVGAFTYKRFLKSVTRGWLRPFEY